MAVNINKVLSGGLPETITKNISTANTATAEVASPADASDFREIFEAGVNGGFYDGILIQWIGTGTQTAHIIYIWETDSAGANARIVEGHTFTTMSAAISATNLGTKRFLPYNFANLTPGTKVFVSSTVVSASCSCNVTLRGGQFESQ